MKKDKKLEQAMRECEAFLAGCVDYNKRINDSYWTNGVDSFKVYEDAHTERGTLKARSLLLIRKLQAWRKRGNVE